MFENKPNNPHSASSRQENTCECICCGNQRPEMCGICPTCGTYECSST